MRYRYWVNILGVDPGIARTGWGVIELISNKYKARDYGCIETRSNDSIEKRLQKIYQELSVIIKTHTPQALAIEELFFNTNAKTALIVGQARGIALLAAAQKKISVSVYTPLQVKIALTGYGRAEKNQIGQMVKTILHLSNIPKPDDTADALAIALTYAFSNGIKSHIA